ncbi:MAG: hypothetical protein PWQ77_240, partial [Kosmotogales bacterium]|nr:hypothetical protein [Kosmotogales bacterium]
MQKRKLGKSGIEVNPLGMGCWAIGGYFILDGMPDGYGKVNDEESIKAITMAVDMGIDFFDTSDVYGTGHSEEILGKALEGKRNEVVIATKFGFTYDSTKREITGTDFSKDYVKWACEQSMKRLKTNYIDLYQLHLSEI